MPKPNWAAPIDVRVTVNKVDLPPDAYRDLLEVTVQEDIDAPSMLTVRLSSWDRKKREISWADEDLFAVGGEVEVHLGYQNAVKPLMKGEITGLELEMSRGEVPSFVVRGYDRRHRLLRGTKTRSFVQMSDSAIAAQIARENGLAADGTDSLVKHEYVLQHAQSDLVFLNRRAEAIGYEVVIEDQTLHFRHHSVSRQPKITLSLHDDVIEFSPRLSTRGQVGAVDVRGWDPKEKKAIVGKAQSGDQLSMGGKFGTAASDGAFGAATITSVDRPLATQGEADKVARGILRNLGLGFVEGEGKTFGRTDLRAGMVASIVGAGQRFSGNYYVTSVTHTYASKKTYRTAFTVRRNAT